MLQLKVYRRVLGRPSARGDFSPAAVGEKRFAMKRFKSVFGGKRGKAKRRQGSTSKRPSNRGLAYEPLEDRRMLAVINWTNETNFTGASDNRFDDVFGTLQTQAVQVIDAAINSWQNVIGRFNY